MNEQQNPLEPVKLRTLFASHGRYWRAFRYVYPVISRRAHGLSIGVNLNPDGACNFDCVYCQVDRSGPMPRGKVELEVLAAELNELVAHHAALFEQPEFSSVPPEYRRLNDIAFSGDGEPTAALVFPEAVQLAADVRRKYAAEQAKIVVITDACFLTRPKVAAALRVLDANNGEIWAKLDAGTEAYFQRVNRPSHALAHVLENITAAARERPVVIQSLFMRLEGALPPREEVAAYVARLRGIREQGGKLKLVQIYTVARRPAEDFVAPLTASELDEIAQQVRDAGFNCEVFT